MDRLFSTTEVIEKDRFRLWRDVCEDRLVPMSQQRLDDAPFHALIEGGTVGALNFTKFSLNNVRASTTPQTIRNFRNNTDQFFISLVVNGSVKSSQNDRSIVTHAGDFVVRDTNTPWTIEHTEHSEVIAISVARNRLESILGSARCFAGLRVDGDHPVTNLARSFLLDLIRVQNRLDARSAERMVDVGIDLIAASISERMSVETHKSIKDSLIFQRAVGFIKTNFCNPSLAPDDVAAASGVSLRTLQNLFRKEGLSVSAWIWQQRLEWAAEHLSDPVNTHMPLGELAYRCGFTDHAHFTRRFRHSFGLSPRDYRSSKLSEIDS